MGCGGLRSLSLFEDQPVGREGVDGTPVVAETFSTPGNSMKAFFNVGYCSDACEVRIGILLRNAKPHPSWQKSRG